MTSMKWGLALGIWGLTIALAGTAWAQTMTPDSGVPLEVATVRAANLSGLRYDLSLSIPEAIAAPITGINTIHFMLKDASKPLVIDFDTSADHVKAVEVNGKP